MLFVLEKQVASAIESFQTKQQPQMNLDFTIIFLPKKVLKYQKVKECGQE